MLCKRIFALSCIREMDNERDYGVVGRFGSHLYKMLYKRRPIYALIGWYWNYY